MPSVNFIPYSNKCQTHKTLLLYFTLALLESVISINAVNDLVTRNVRPTHSCVIRGVSSGQPLWFSKVQVADVLLAPKTIVGLAI